MYRLNTSICNTQNNEIFPQVAHMGLDYDWEDPNAVNQIKENKPLSFNPCLNSFFLDPQTKLTDIVSQSYIYTQGLLISDRLHKEIKKFVIQPHILYPAQVIHNNLTYLYYWLHITEKLNAAIDFKNSHFFEKDKLGCTSPIKFSNFEELQNKCKLLFQNMSGEITATKITFIDNQPNYDLLFILLTSEITLISEELKTYFMVNEFTGFEISSMTTLVNFR